MGCVFCNVIQKVLLCLTSEAAEAACVRYLVKSNTVLEKTAHKSSLSVGLRTFFAAVLDPWFLRCLHILQI
ncbi:hypothetical protein DPMN_130492 [Dreissena polymorpha]|uniref:Secreted protein n=1 Tax=Dreissena polymorpha TaxID=45954 RepID=A0A9D4HB31_DREPO|nr:hypothetical protein DPMN_130492 [Dreissena polymorpha]